jgi:hypothetical protein
VQEVLGCRDGLNNLKEQNNEKRESEKMQWQRAERGQ